MANKVRNDGGGERNDVVKFKDIWNEMGLFSRTVLLLLVLTMLAGLALFFLIFQYNLNVGMPWSAISSGIGVGSFLAIIIFFYCHGVGTYIRIS